MEKVALQGILREGRRKLGWTQLKVAEAVGCSESRITQIEAGSNPSPELLRKLADLYGLDYAYLMSLIVEKDNDEYSKEERAVINAIRAKDTRRVMKLVQRLIYT